ncbi:membrane protein ORF138 [Cyprinid herpesvirus 2]|nr:membrane protein ORF138 [Cyprinid herpesvirus 2]
MISVLCLCVSCDLCICDLVLSFALRSEHRYGIPKDDPGVDGFRDQHRNAEINTVTPRSTTMFMGTSTTTPTTSHIGTSSTSPNNNNMTTPEHKLHKLHYGWAIFFALVLLCFLIVVCLPGRKGEPLHWSHNTRSPVYIPKAAIEAGQEITVVEV